MDIEVLFTSLSLAKRRFPQGRLNFQPLSKCGCHPTPSSGVGEGMLALKTAGNQSLV